CAVGAAQPAPIATIATVVTTPAILIGLRFGNCFSGCNGGSSRADPWWQIYHSLPRMPQ
ncbi:MAG: hypothetical protein ACI88G_001420, partial [Woeseiaceae bacterium]